MTEATINEFKTETVDPLLAEPLSSALTLNDVGNGDEWWLDLNKLLQAKTVGPKGEEQFIIWLELSVLYEYHVGGSR